MSRGAAAAVIPSLISIHYGIPPTSQGIPQTYHVIPRCIRFHGIPPTSHGISRDLTDLQRYPTVHAVCAPSRKGCVVNSQMTEAKNKRVPPPPTLAPVFDGIPPTAHGIPRYPTDLPRCIRYLTDFPWYPTVYHRIPTVFHGISSASHPILRHAMPRHGIPPTCGISRTFIHVLV